MRGTGVVFSLVAACAIALAFGVVVAQHDHHAETPHAEAHAEVAPDVAPDVAESLSSELRELLDKEMWKIDDGMRHLATAVSLGDWKSTAETAFKIRDSYILKQQLTGEQAHELHEKLPAEFLELDGWFHETSGKLAHAAHGHDAELVTFYYYRLLDGCVQCHAKFAPKRFPGLAGVKPAKHEH